MHTPSQHQMAFFLLSPFSNKKETLCLITNASRTNETTLAPCIKIHAASGSTLKRRVVDSPLSGQLLLLPTLLGSAALSELLYGLAHIKIHLENSTRTKDLLHPYEQYESLLLLVVVVF
jgi:hypothetical protein